MNIPHNFKGAPNNRSSASSAVSSVPSPVAELAADPFDLANGAGPRCITCRKNVSMCWCDEPEPDVMPVEDMMRIGWALAERAALGMSK